MRDYYVGRVQGGPLDDTLASSRFPKGFLLVNKPAGKAWIYDWNGEVFLCREPEGLDLDDTKRWDAAEGSEYDVRAYSEPTEVAR